MTMTCNRWTMTAVLLAALAALTVYDMCKGSDKSISVGEIRLLYKEGGKSGVYRRDAVVVHDMDGLMGEEAV